MGISPDIMNISPILLPPKTVVLFIMPRGGGKRYPPNIKLEQEQSCFRLFLLHTPREVRGLGRKNRRKESAYSRKMRLNPEKLISRPQTDTVHSGQDPVRGDIWFAELGKHPGTSVQEGCRPVLIMSNDTANGHSGTVTVVPMTSKKKKAYLPTHVLMEASDCPILEPSMVLAEQVTTIGKCALKSFVGRVGESKIHEIEKAVEVHLGLASCCISDRWNACISGKGV